jgi:hypothetical protein
MMTEDIAFNIQTEFHTLRHFESVDTTIENRLLAAGYTQGNIKTERAILGSKFHTSFASSVEKLLARIADYPFVSRVGINGNLTLEYDINTKDFPQGIGTCGILNKAELSQKQVSEIYVDASRGYDVNVVSVSSLPNTNTCTLIVTAAHEGRLLISAFPGSAAMPLPNNKMPEEMYRACVAFWAEHVFLKLS